MVQPGFAHGMTAQEKWFTTTHWSKIALAGERTTAESTAALEHLCGTYWYPLYAYLRRRGYDPPDAEDLTQEFFARLLRDNSFAKADPAKGKFRSFLLTALNRFLANQQERAHALKRGGGQPLLTLDMAKGEERYQGEPACEATPERLFERKWALTLLDQALQQLRQEFVSQSKAARFEELKAFLCGNDGLSSYVELATRWQTTPNAVAAAVHRFRLRYRELVREQIAQTVTGEDKLEEELCYLFNALKP
jgi:RNA polymerase sigma factor (sigma-70 family)